MKVTTIQAQKKWHSIFKKADYLEQQVQTLEARG